MKLRLLKLVVAEIKLVAARKLLFIIQEIEGALLDRKDRGPTNLT